MTDGQKTERPEERRTKTDSRMFRKRWIGRSVGELPNYCAALIFHFISPFTSLRSQYSKLSRDIQNLKVA